MIITNPFRPSSWTREERTFISQGWWIVLITGFVGVLAGGIILSVDWTVDNLATFIGTVLIVRGLFMTFGIPVDGAVRRWSIATGILEAIVGLAVFVWPAPTLLVVASVIGWYVLFSGLMTIAGAVSGRRVLPYWGLMLVVGIAEAVISFWLLARPGLTLVATVLALGLWSMTLGIIQIVLAFEVRALANDLDSVAVDLDGAAPQRRPEPVGSH